MIPSQIKIQQNDIKKRMKIQFIKISTRDEEEKKFFHFDKLD